MTRPSSRCLLAVCLLTLTLGWARATEDSEDPGYPPGSLPARMKALEERIQEAEARCEPRALVALRKQMLALVEEKYHASHPELVDPLLAMASLQCEMADFAAASASLDRAQSIVEKAFGDRAPVAAEVQLGYAKLFAAQYQHPQAEAAYGKAIGSMRRFKGPKHPDLVWLQAELARVLRMQGKHEQAERELRQALALAAESGDEDAVKSMAHELVDLLRGLGRKADAERLESQHGLKE